MCFYTIFHFFVFLVFSFFLFFVFFFNFSYFFHFFSFKWWEKFTAFYVSQVPLCFISLNFFTLVLSLCCATKILIFFFFLVFSFFLIFRIFFIFLALNDGKFMVFCVSRTLCFISLNFYFSFILLLRYKNFNLFLLSGF